MISLIGEYDCKLDAKGRFLVPAGLKKQLPEDQQSEFVVNRGLDKCLVLYPVPVWEQELERLQARNQYVKKNRAFLRMFLNGATKVALDGNGRALVPKRLMEFAGLDKEVILVAQIDKVEIWDKAAYEEWMDNPEFDFESLAEEVMGEDHE
ncbi:division/cell wall cluster transcriptional repressor MraZ [Pontibacter sp. G13]|uniref:division/cell wall cluster transcriptional repressor MraZ n=1 Tax=Pontibacter sp. G13 TaxID=3074898 RepID=UPI0028894C48|nr:division/cell wall cluster transcriptional repressor MraZ [Pontibacter sp. G13]WNJ20262.1 division/cell wall cluster transcriptional repressor MraZ [Pontibacter sp. G13]